MTGFTFFYRGKDYFIETSRINKTRTLAIEILQALQFHKTEQNISYILSCLNRAECETKTLSNGRRYYDIHGDGFGGKGSFIDDGNTVIIKI